MGKNLYDIMGQNIHIPKSFTDSISTFEYESKRQIKMRLHRKVALAFSFLIASISLVTYGIKTSENFKAESSIGYVDSSLQQAVENGYIQNIDMEYAYSNGVGAKVDYVIMSDYNLNILFNFDISKKNIKQNTRAYIEDLLIYDENNNVIYCYDYETYKDFCKKNDIEYDKNKLEQYGNGIGCQQIETSENINKTLYAITATKGFPKCKKIYIKFNAIYFDKEKTNRFNGKWNLELNLDEQFYNREEIKYELQTTSNDIELITANITDTTMRIMYKMKNIDKSKLGNISMYIEDNFGNTYDVNNVEDVISIFEEQISVTFPVSIRDDFEYLTLYISIDKQEYISVILERKDNENLSEI